MSILAAYDDGKTGFSLGTNFWSGNGGMDDFKQQIGTLGLHFGDFRAQYENDGNPFSGISADGNDQYRTAAVYFSYKSYRVGVNSEWIRHAIQNVAIHGTFVANERMFEMQNGDWNGYFQ